MPLLHKEVFRLTVPAHVLGVLIGVDSEFQANRGHLMDEIEHQVVGMAETSGSHRGHEPSSKDQAGGFLVLGGRGQAWDCKFLERIGVELQARAFEVVMFLDELMA